MKHPGGRYRDPKSHNGMVEEYIQRTQSRDRLEIANALGLTPEQVSNTVVHLRYTQRLPWNYKLMRVHKLGRPGKHEVRDPDRELTQESVRIIQQGMLMKLFSPDDLAEVYDISVDRVVDLVLAEPVPADTTYRVRKQHHD